MAATARRSSGVPGLLVVEGLYRVDRANKLKTANRLLKRLADLGVDVEIKKVAA